MLVFRETVVKVDLQSTSNSNLHSIMPSHRNNGDKTRKRASNTNDYVLSSDYDDDPMQGTANQLQTRKKTLRAAKKTKVTDKPHNVVHDDIPANIKIQVPTSNRFENLTNNIDEVRLMRPSIVTKPKKNRIPPIIASHTATNTTLKANLIAAGVKNFRLKMASIGQYIFVDNIEDHRKIRVLMEKSGTPYFSHDLPEDRVAKVVLKGLEKLETDKLKEELTSLGFPPLDIKTIVPKQSRYSDQVNYIIYFKRESTDLKALYRVKAINYTVVHWEPYRSSRSTLTQCRRCQRYGHGTRHCHMPARCLYCTNSHESQQCPAVKAAYDSAKEKLKTTGTTEEVEPQVLDGFLAQCCNCNGSHLASDPTCPERERYQRIQRNASQRNSRRSQAIKQLPSHATDFPPLPGNNYANAPISNSQRKMTNCNQQRSFSQVTAQGCTKRHTTQLMPVSSQNDPGNSCSSDLFSFQEINCLLQELISDLGRCRNKSEQFQVITNLAIKYIYDGPK